MGREFIDALASAGANITITMTADELRSFARDIANSVAEQMSSQTVDAIKLAMGDTMKYCTTEEVKRDYDVSQSTLSNWIARGIITPIKKGGKNLFLRDDVLLICRRKNR